MSTLESLVADLSDQVEQLETRFADLAGDLAELRTIMGPFLARYNALIMHHQEKLALIQREIADRKTLTGDRQAGDAGQVESPLDRFVGDKTVQSQFEETWGSGKKLKDHLKELSERNPASPELKGLYKTVALNSHPALGNTKIERERRRQLMLKIDDAYVQRNLFSLKTVVASYPDPRELPTVADPNAVEILQDRILTLEAAVAEVEGQRYELRYGVVAKIKLQAERLWAAEKRDLLSELSAELQRILRYSELELEQLQSKT